MGWFQQVFLLSKYFEILTVHNSSRSYIGFHETVKGATVVSLLSKYFEILTVHNSSRSYIGFHKTVKGATVV